LEAAVGMLWDESGTELTAKRMKRKIKLQVEFYVYVKYRSMRYMTTEELDALCLKSDATDYEVGLEMYPGLSHYHLIFSRLTDISYRVI
jgi:hypothetical protein